MYDVQMYRKECDVGDKTSVGDQATTQVVATVGVKKHDGENNDSWK